MTDKIFKHSGNIGDIIYSLPSMKEAGGGIFQMQTTNLMPEDYAKDMVQLLRSQPYIRGVQIATKPAPYNVELDAFRRRPIQLIGGHIAMWYNHTTGVFPDISKKWLLGIKKNDAYKNAIIINRTQRYRNEDSDYTILNKIGKKKLFWGSDREFAEFSYFVPDAERLIVPNYLELAEIIAGCHAFVGNTSFCYAIAEALKVKRIVEVPIHSPNAFPVGENGFQHSFQDMFQLIVDRYL